MHRTDIEFAFTIKCECGEDVDIECFGYTSTPYGECDACEHTTYVLGDRSPLLTILNHFGVHPRIEYDDQLYVESNEKLPINLKHWMTRHQRILIDAVKDVGADGTAFLMGGPLAGESVANIFRHGRVYMEGTRLIASIKRANWVVYERPVTASFYDRRYFYQGTATSEKKARAGQFKEAV